MATEIIRTPDVDKLNKDAKQFWEVHPITPDMKNNFSGVSRMVMFDRYAFKDLTNKTLGKGDMVVITVKNDSQYPVRGIGIVQKIEDERVTIWVQEDYQGSIENEEERETGIVTRTINQVDKPMELYFEQIAARVANAQSKIEKEELQEKWEKEFNSILATRKYVPAGRILFGSNSDTEVTLYNCFILPNPEDSREGLAIHRGISAEVMSRGGGIGYAGSALRPKDVLAKGVNGRSSGSISWLADHSELTHLIQQGGSRRGAQMQQLLD